jgi:hypothetical protein
MSWLDSVVAVPLIGAEILLPLKIAANKGQHFAPFLDYFSSKGGANIKDQAKLFVGRDELGREALKVRSSGYYVDLADERLTSGFNYEVPVVKKGGFPSWVIPEMQPFTKLLEVSMQNLTEAAKMLDRQQAMFGFIGFVAFAEMDPEVLPPGVERFLQHLGDLWDGILELQVERLTCKLSEDEFSTRRCHHSLKFNKAKPEDGFSLRIDWQNVFKEKIPFVVKEFTPKLEECKKAFLEYCERFGEGNLNYDDKQ